MCKNQTKTDIRHDRFEDALRVSEARLRAITDHAQDAILMMDSEGLVSFWNPSAEKIFGYSSAEVLGQNLHDLIAPSRYLQKHHEMYRLFQTTGEGDAVGKTIELMARRKDGTEIPVELSMSAIKLDGWHAVGLIRDISRRKNAETALLGSYQFAQSTVDALRSHIAILDKEGKIIAVNQAWKQFAEANLSGCETAYVGYNYLEVCDCATGAGSDGAADFAKGIRTILDGRCDEYAQEYPCHSDSEKRWFIGRATSFQIDGDTRVVIAHENITERKLSEDKLSQLYMAVEQSPSLIVITDSRGNIEYVNPKFNEVTGYSSGEVIGLNPRVLQSGESPAKVYQELWDTISKGKVWHGEFHNKKKDGSLYWESASISPIRGPAGEISHYLAVKEDITKRKKAMEDKKKQDGLIRSLLDSIPDLIFYKDTNGVYLGCNSPFAGFVGKSKHDIVGKTDLELFSLEVGQSFQEHDRLMLDKCEPRHNEEVLTYPDGRQYLVETLKTPYWGPDGGLIGILGISRDITKQRTMQSQLSQSQKLESIGQLAAGIAHEINTPMQYVSDNTRFLRDACLSLINIVEFQRLLVEHMESDEGKSAYEILKKEQEKQDLDYLVEQIPLAIDQSLGGISRIATIVRAMKEFSHPDADHPVLSDINEAIKSTVEVSRNEWKYVADLELDLAPDMPQVPCYLGEFNQVILNLIINAAHAIGDIYRTTGSRGTIIVSTRLNDEGFAEIGVKDSGTGIPVTAQPRIFDPFFTTKEVGKGTGQGLAIAHNVITNHHQGKISFTTQEGVGTRFTIQLPLDTNRAPTDEVAS